MPIFQARVRIDYAGEGAPAYNIWNCRTESVLPGEDLADNLTNLVAFYNSIKALYPSNATITIPDDVVRVDVDPPEGQPVSPATVGGTGAGGESPEMLAMVVGWATTVRTRSGRGRTFIGPLAKNVQDVDGTPRNDSAGELEAAAQALVALGSVENANGAWGVYSRKDGVIRDFTNARVRPDQFSVLRSRRD